MCDVSAGTWSFYKPPRRHGRTFSFTFIETIGDRRPVGCQATTKVVEVFLHEVKLLLGFNYRMFLTMFFSNFPLDSYARLGSSQPPTSHI